MDAVFKGLNGQDVHVKVQFDRREKVVHVFDKDVSPAPTVTNSVEELRPQIMDRLGLMGHPDDYHWFLYGTDGLVAEYDMLEFCLVQDEDRRVDEGFLRMVKGRRR